MKTKAFVFILFFFTSLNAQTTYYFSTSGNDTSDGLTSSSAKQTLSALQTLLDVAQPGDKFLLKRGDIWRTRGGRSTKYSGVVGIDLTNVDGTSWSPGNYITIGAYGTGSRPVWDFVGSGADFQMEGGHYIIIRDLYLTGSDSDPTNRPGCAFDGIGSLDGGGNNIKIINVAMDGVGQGARIQDQVNTITFDSCAIENTCRDFYPTGNYGQGIYCNTHDLIVKNTTFHNIAPGIEPNSPGHNHCIYALNVSNLLVENCSFSRDNRFGGTAFSLVNCKNTVIRKSTMYNFDDALVLGERGEGNNPYADSVVVDGCTFRGNGISLHIEVVGLPDGDGANNVYIMNNTFSNSLGNYYPSGIFIEQIKSLNNLEILNNTFRNLYNEAIRFAGATYVNCVVKNNIFYNDSDASADLIRIDNSNYLSSITLDYNLYYNTKGNTINVGNTTYSLSSFQSTYSQELNGLYGDPLFENATDFKISKNSPCIDKGDSLTNVINDFYGNPRPQGAGYDIGAFEYEAANPKLNIKIFLQGPFNDGIMSTELSKDGYISLTQPYNHDPWNYTGTESVSSIPVDVVDWVLLELRTGTDSSSIVTRKAAFVKNDGSVVDLDGKSNVSFKSVPEGSYYVIVMHRNHLPIMSANAIPLNSNSSLYDFTTSPSQAYGTDALVDLGNGKWGMYAGDSDTNGTINVLDYGNVVNFLFDTGYKLGDLDLNGVINVLDYSKTNSNMFRSSQVPN